VLEKQLFDPQQGKSNKHVNIFFSFLLAQMVLSLFNSMQAYTFLFMIRIFFSYYKKNTLEKPTNSFLTKKISDPRQSAGQIT
jgi:hypothetical protein